MFKFYIQVTCSTVPLPSKLHLYSTRTVWGEQLMKYPEHQAPRGLRPNFVPQSYQLEGESGDILPRGRHQRGSNPLDRLQQEPLAITCFIGHYPLPTPPLEHSRIPVLL